MPKRGKIAHSLLDLAPNPGAESPAACVRPRCGSRGLSGGARPGSRRPRVRGRPHLPLCLSPSRPTEEGRDLRDALGPGRSEARLPDAQRPREPPACGRPGPRSPRAEGGSDHSRGPSWAGGGAGTAAGGGGLGGAVLRPRASRGRACGPGPGASARGAAPPQAGPWPAGSAGSRGGAAPRPAGSAVAPVARACPTRPAPRVARPDCAGDRGRELQVSVPDAARPRLRRSEELSKEPNTAEQDGDASQTRTRAGMFLGE